MEISWLILPRGRGDSTIAPLWSPSLVTSATSPLGPPPTARSIFTRTGWEKWGRWGVTSSSQLSEQWGRRWSSWVQSATLRPSGPLVSPLRQIAHFENGLFVRCYSLDRAGGQEVLVGVICNSGFSSQTGSTVSTSRARSSKPCRHIVIHKSKNLLNHKFVRSLPTFTSTNNNDQMTNASLVVTA